MDTKKVIEIYPTSFNESDMGVPTCIKTDLPVNLLFNQLNIYKKQAELPTVVGFLDYLRENGISAIDVTQEPVEPYAVISHV